MSFAAVVVLSCILAAEPPAGLERIDAKAWLNAPSLPKEDADYVLFFFGLRSDREVKETVRYLGTLNRVDRDPSTRVLGLTPEHPERVESFLKIHDVRFAIAAGSRCARRFGVRRPPALVSLKRGATAQPLSLEEARRLASKVPSDLRELSKAELRELVTADASGWDRAGAISRLYAKMDKAEYIAFGESRLPEETNPWVRGRLEYFLHLAKGIARSDDEMSDSTYAQHLFRENSDAPEWQPVQTYLKARTERKLTANELQAQYVKRETMTPQDVLVRRFVAGDLWNASDRPAAREVLMQIIATELDPSIRMIGAMGLGEVCPTGDDEVADFLDEMAAVEENITRVRPMMEYVSHLIRTGQEDERTMPPPGP